MKHKILMLLLSAVIYYCHAGTPGIVLNQCGFYPYSNKIAVVINSPVSEYFYIISAEKKDTVYKGELQPPVQSSYSPAVTRIADFSSFHQSGRYIVYVKGIPPSTLFYISNNVFEILTTAALKSFYYQRSAMPLEEKYAGQWKRPAGHPDTQVLVHPSAATTSRPAGTVISCPGGWYDAGDYNKYIVNSGITMGTLLSAYEDFPDFFAGLQTNIPESNNQLPDLLDELLYNLRWMLTMQDPNDGGVYHKCTNAAFDGQVMPGVTKLPRYVVQKSTAATLDFAAVMAQSARIFKQFPSALPGLSDSCLNAAVYAWNWATRHPEIAYDQSDINASFAPPITTGAYGDRFFTDERFWAAAELLATTGKKEYLAAINAYPIQQLQLASWSNVGMLGCYTLMRSNRSAEVKSKNIPYDLIRNQLLRFADNLIANGGNMAFQTIMGQSRKDYIWGSNAVALNQSIALINAYMITDTATYLRAALSNLDYVLGRNATGYCFVTGAGSKSPLHIHHRPSQADGIAAPVPGLLAGGPNPGMQDKVHYPLTDPETAYIDNEKAYACNEIAINWNAPLVYVSAAFEALKRKATLSLY